MTEYTVGNRFKVKPFNDLPKEERIKIIYYSEEARKQGMQQVLAKLKNDIGKNQKAKITKWINEIEKSLETEYEVLNWSKDYD